MTPSDDYGFDDDDTEFIAAATQVEASQHAGGFETSPRPTKKRRVQQPNAGQLDGESASELASSGSDGEQRSPVDGTKDVARSMNIPAVGSEDRPSDKEPDVDEEYYFPGELDNQNGNASTKNSKYKIHVPKDGGQFENMIFTQTQVGLDSSPGRFRGPVWKRPKPPPPPLFDAQHSNRQEPHTTSHGQKAGIATNITKQSDLGRPGHLIQREQSEESDAAMAARLQAQEEGLANRRPEALQPGAMFSRVPMIETHEELADLPSDAFSSSSPEKSPQRETTHVSPQRPTSQTVPPRLRGPQVGLKQMTIFGQAATQEIPASQTGKKKHAWPLKDREEPPTHHKLDSAAMKTWIYPTNLGTVRDYQYNIVSRSLFHNTLVALPTGLGKTFIAATIMLNYYRWTADAQIIFMAPTKPLIAQQMEACYGIVGIRRQDTVLMTGETTPAVRAEEWLEKRVFFMTPQTVINDLKTGICDPKKVVLVVVDEAHKATGSYAYTEVVAFLRRFNSSFRVLALTATPGSTVEAVQAVIDHLGIARVELRTEQSLDIRPYTHKKQTELELFEYSDEQQLVMEHLSRALKPLLDKLNSLNAYFSRDPMALSAYGLTQARQKWMASDAGRKAPMAMKGMANAAFTVLSQFGHSIGLLKFHGIGPFYSGALEFQRSVDSGKTKGKNAKAVVEHEDFVKMMSRIRGWTNNPDFIGHPKLQYLREVVLNHFLDAGEGTLGSDAPPSATRVMVFASYRDSTEEICRVLKRNEPMIRPHVFVGQAASNNSEGMNQKRQNAVIQDFKAGKFNTLVATSIGEEGLDIGDVDLIVCYDASSSPIRMLQRIGRTGRKRVGKVTLLLMRDKEERDYAKAQDNYAWIQKSIADSNKYDYRDDQSPRILPKEAQPVVDKCIIEIPLENTQQPIDLNEKGRRARGKGKAKRPPKKFHMPDGVRTGFTTASKLDADTESEENSNGLLAKKSKAAPAKKNSAAAAKKSAGRAEPEPEVVQLPYLQDVLLNDSQQKELERKYAYTASGEDQLVQAPDFGRFPEAFRTPGSTKYMRHGRASHTVSKAFKALQDVNDGSLSRMTSFADNSRDENQSLGMAQGRIADPAASESEHELPARPPPATKPKKAGGRPKKNNDRQRLQRVASYGSAAMEGEESEPEPTQADMQLGTQVRLGEDLGSRDTSGEDEDEEEPDSELAAFIAKSDEAIEPMTSSTFASDDRVERSKRHAPTSRGLRRKQPAITKSLSTDNENDSENESDSDSTMTSAAPLASKRRKAQRIVESDSE
ncbi:P-loop containing nucleoside triphosphate hydrolase protein [Hortaea werneckii]|nr:P-loop containing nucleoside triphosphate hydrolase protein [Hortaea werneckii]KAI7084192.1 P-loop containing nucleoside triphosphate hydrolase protein [Hortaea werneckii]KAI7229330.1 P-loop containing nucleoside triphosphate hydrolase protein [Hortaea werneckii]KAI7307969.1 P-loop containing nucleoside triphosphate hydrolase protein [Hortaea werneckii]KAI7393823.1 P-loop containing nucleoside triphosphate hydrolase protein [Hortaea werneckii]